jgi:ABC-type polysaccharide/polyol phosphate transport system ATPase subunit
MKIDNDEIKLDGVFGPYQNKEIIVEGSESFNLDRFNGFTICLWIKFNETQTGSLMAKMNDDKTDNFRGWDLRLQEYDGKQNLILNLIHKHPVNRFTVKTYVPEEVYNNEWHHIAVIHNGHIRSGSIKIFIDGKLQNSFAVSLSLTDILNNNYPITLCSRLNPQNYFNGKLKDILILKRKLKQPEILELIDSSNEKVSGSSLIQYEDKILLEVKNMTKIFSIQHQNNLDIFSEIITRLFRKKQVEKMIVLDDISFDLRQGEMLGILGKNGSGKTTLLKILGKIMKPTSGIIEAHGKTSTLLSLGSGFHPELTAKQNVILYGTILGETKDQMKKKVDEVIRFAELEKFADVELKDFSTGMVMRLAFSTALCVEPDILLVDEVISVGDYSFQTKSLAAFLKIKNSGKSIIFVSHNLNQMEQFCDRIILINNGKIIMEGEPENVIDTYLEIVNKS